MLRVLIIPLSPLSDHAHQAVYVSGARGHAPTDTYKVCATHADGYRSTAVCCVGGPRAAAKARRTTDAILKRSVGFSIDTFIDRSLLQ